MDKIGRVIHILIVEDDEMQLELIKDAFSTGQNQYAIQTASSLKETYAILSQDTPDVILTDNKLPDGEGKELIKAAQGNIPLVLMTAHGSEEFAVQAIKEGAQDYIVKSPEFFRRAPETVKHVLLQWKLKIEKEQSEKALLESEQKFRELFNNINDAVFLHEIGVDKMHNPFIEVNEVACEILGYTKEELLTMSLFDISSSEQVHNAGNIEDKVLSEGSVCFEMGLVTKKGNHIPVEINAHIFEYNQMPAVLSVARDITEQKQYQQYIEHLNSLLLAIRNVNQLIIQETDVYRMVQKAAGMLVETLAYSGCVIALMNEEIKKIVPVTHIGNAFLTKYFAISSNGKGKAPKCIKNAVFSKKIHVTHDIKMCTDCSYSGCNADNKAVTVVVPMLRKENIIGLMIVTRQHKAFLTNKEEQLLLEVADDLAFAREKIMVEASHRESENKYRSLFMAEPDPIFLVDENTGMFLDANPAAEDLYGYTHDELLTMKASDLSYEPDETQKAIKIEDDNIVHIPERIHKKKNGDKIIVEISARHFERNGRMINISSIRDITERKRAEEELVLTQHTINNTELSIFWISPQGKFLYVNEGACRNLGYSKDELLNMYVWDVDHNSPQNT
ncbi:MAG: PAS domain S-box protein, partial [Bacteroidota bacterium]